MVKYEFGVMSRKWSLESEDMIIAYISMSIFIGKNIPIAVYSPQTYGFMPMDILNNNKEAYEPKLVNACLNTIKEIQIGGKR